jgi:hypothetical protein
LLSTAALADCPMRNPTGSESQFHKRVFAALKEALPPPPPNWTLAPVREQVVGGLCEGAGEGAFDIRVMGNYSYKPPKEEGDRLYAEHRKLQSQIDALRQMPPDINKERQGWLDKMSEANRASNRAAKEGNKQLAREKDAEAEGYSRKGREVRDKYIASVQQQLDQLEARRQALEYGGSAVKLSLVANDHDPRSPDPKAGSEMIFGKTPTPKSPGLKVHNVRAVVEGSAVKREQIQAGIDKVKLARIVQ